MTRIVLWFFHIFSFDLATIFFTEVILESEFFLEASPSNKK